MRTLLCWSLVWGAGAGCAGVPEGADRPKGSEAEAVAAAISAWAAADLDPVGERCQAEERLLSVVTVDDGGLDRECGTCRPGLCGGQQRWDRGQCPLGCSAGCFGYEAHEPWPAGLVGTQTPLIVIHESVAAREHLTIHEALHWLGFCTGRGLDLAHLDPHVWSARGGDSSVQARAERWASTGRRLPSPSPLGSQTDALAHPSTSEPPTVGASRRRDPRQNSSAEGETVDGWRAAGPGRSL